MVISISFSSLSEGNQVHSLTLLLDMAAILDAKEATFLNFCCLKTAVQSWNSTLYCSRSLLQHSYETEYNYISPEKAATVYIFFGWKTAEVYTPLGLASDLKPQYIISSPDSLWLGRHSSSVGRRGSANTLVLYRLVHKFTFCSRVKILILFYTVWRHYWESSYPANSFTKNIEKLRHEESQKRIGPYPVNQLYFPTSSPLTTSLSSFPFQSLTGLWIWSKLKLWKWKTITFLQIDGQSISSLLS